MSASFKTEQEVFWAGEFGNTYVDRNSGSRSVSHRTAVFAKILHRTQDVKKILELGANVGDNIHAIKNLLPQCAFTAVEINDKAIATLSKIPRVKVVKGSMLDISPSRLGKHDLTMTVGVLIHINPDFLPKVYTLLYQCSTAYILIDEYYNPKPVAVEYRGHKERLFKRDFAGDMLEKFPDLELVDYGFQYHRDRNFPSDDRTWFLMKKRILGV